MVLTESMEDYLEAIYRLDLEKGYVRLRELAQVLQVQPPSVTRMVRKLDEGGFVHYRKYRQILLTDRGREIGRFLVWRDQLLLQFLYLVSGERDVKSQVEGIEHYITPKTMIWIKKLVTFLRTNPEYVTELQRARAGDYPEGIDLKELRAWNFRHP